MKKSKREAKGAAVAVEGQAPVKKRKKGKKAEDAGENQESVSIPGLDSAEAPWANEAVPDVAADHLEQAKVKTQRKRQKSAPESANGAMNTDQALALLGFAEAKPLSKQQKRKKREH